MAPPTSRRSKQAVSSPSPPPNLLPGIAFGIFAAVAAGFAASRALRRKRRLQSLKEKEHAAEGDSLIVHEQEIQINEQIEPDCTADDTVTKAQGSPKLTDDLEFVVDAMKPGLSLHKSSAEGKHEDEVVNRQIPWGILNNEGEEKIAEIVDKGEICKMTVDSEIPFVSGESSLKALRSSVLMEEGEAENYMVGAEDEDTGEDGDDDRSSADQPLSPILINERILDFFEEMSDLIDEPDCSGSGGYSLSDSVSECSMHEVSSAPVKPILLADDAMEAIWMSSKPDFVGASDQFGQEGVLLEGKNWSDVERTPCMLEHGLSTMQGSLPDIEEMDPQADKEIFNLEEGLADSNDELDVVVDGLDEKPVLITMDEKGFSINDIDGVDVGTLSHSCVVLEGGSSEKLIEDCTDSARINGKVLSDARSLGGCNQIVTTSTEQLLQATKEIADDILGLTLKDEAHGDSSRINGKILSVESQNQPSSLVGLTSIARPDLLSTVEETAYEIRLDRLSKTELQPTKGLPLGVPDADIKVEPSVELIQEVAGSGSIADNVLQFTRGVDVYNSDATCGSSGVMIVGKTDEERTMGISMDNQVENSMVEPDAELMHEMVGVESGSLEEHYAEETANQSADGHDARISVLIKDDDTAVLTQTEGVLTNNLAVISELEPNADLTEEMTGLESDSLEKSSHGEEPAMQARGQDLTISEVSTDNNSGTMCDAGLEGTMGDSNYNLAVKSRVEPSVDPTEEMTCLKSDPLKESLYAEVPAIKAGEHEAAIPTITTDDEPLGESLHEEDPGNQVGGHEAAIPNITIDDNPDATYDTVGLEDHTSLNETAGVSIENPVVKSEPIVESAQGVSCSESGPLQDFNGEEPVFQSGGCGIDISDITDGIVKSNVNIQEQPGSPLPPLEDSLEHNDIIFDARADKVELASRKEDEVARSGVSDIRLHSKQQEIEEILKADDAINNLQETAPVTHSLHRSFDNQQEFDELCTRGAAGVQSRSTLSGKVVKYLPIEIGLICLLIASISFVLKYLEVPLSIATNGSP